MIPIILVVIGFLIVPFWWGGWLFSAAGVLTALIAWFFLRRDPGWKESMQLIKAAKRKRRRKLLIKIRKRFRKRITTPIPEMPPQHT
jgi:hypothetical protein